jgi:ubiquinone/menaquinone biosynthesis C-methylase UbiE
LSYAVDFTKRSYELEHIDVGDYTDDEYKGCIVELQRVNRWLGDARTLRQTLLKEIQDSDLREFSVLDVGAGSGELLRVTSDWARTSQRSSHLVGLELNPTSAKAIRDESRQFHGISAVRGDAFHLPFKDLEFDYAISSLFTHHFTDVQVVALLREMARVARRGIYVIDLHRHPVAYYLYTTIGKLMLHNRLLREDGALSIRRSFKADELLALAQRAGLSNARVDRHFPYRLVLSMTRLAQRSQSSDHPSPVHAHADKAA